MTIRFRVFILLLFFWLAFHSAFAFELIKKEKRIVLIAGAKSHGPGEHEYIKTVRLLKTMFDNSNVAKSIETDIVLNGWPQDERLLDSADLILTISDGQDGDLYAPVPFMLPGRMAVMEKQMKRGCGFATVHFSTFAPDSLGKKIIEWGGYFDWQGDDGKKAWYSAIQTKETAVRLPSPTHPVVRGVQSFTIKDEFYYNIRFNPEDSRFRPLLEVPALGGRKEAGNAVAWAVERRDGGRGFGTTMGHYFTNWQHPQFRKFMLNAIVWAAGAAVPAEGVEAKWYTDEQVTRHLYKKRTKGLILTGHHYPGHHWEKTTPLIKAAIEKDPALFTDVSTNIEDLAQCDLNDYSFLVLNYCNWQEPKGLSDAGKKAFTSYLNNGGGLMIIHFANGAFHYSLPDAGASDWPEFRKICRRVWDHNSNSAHDDYGPFKVEVTSLQSPITKGLASFETMDELYFNQKGEEPVEPLLVARSKKTGKDEPLAWVYTYGKGRIFQTVLGHSAESFASQTFGEILKRAALYVAMLPVAPKQ